VHFGHIIPKRTSAKPEQRPLKNRRQNRRENSTEKIVKRK
jgi:hypothetical protein